MELYLIRHGEFVGNLVAEDTPDGPLTAKGRWEAELVAARLRSARLTHVIASPLMRALETANAIATQSGLRFAVWKETYEYRNKGRYIGPAVSQLARMFPLADFGDDMEPAGWVCPGTESPDDVVARGRRVISCLFRTYGDEDRVALVSHAGFNSILLGLLLGAADPHSLKFRQKNACVNHLRFAGNTVYVEEINGATHLLETWPGEQALPSS